MIRIAEVKDVPECVGYARKFHAQSTWQHIPFCEDSARATITGLINNEEAIIFLNGTGFIGAVMAPVLFNHDFRIAYEMFWFAERNGRELIAAYEAWADSNKAIPLMVCLEDEKVETMSRLYRRRGYRPTERYFVKGSV